MHRTFRTLTAILFLAVFVGFSSAASQDLSGDWEGAIDIAGTKLKVEIHLEKGAEGQWTGNVDIPQQGARDLPLSNIEIAPPDAAFSIEGIPGEPRFDGSLSEEGTITGDFTQGGQTFPYELERRGADGSADALEGFDEFATSAMDDWMVPGAAVAVVADGEVLLMEGYGFRDREKELPVTADTMFAIGSSTKAFTSMIIGMLVDDGMIDWEKPVREYMPDFKLKDKWAAERMNVVDLLTHRSGLPRHDLMWYGSPMGREELYRSLEYLEPSADLRTEFQYQNLMFMTAGYMAGRITGSTWEDLVRSRIFGPLGMTESNFSVETMKSTDNFSMAYEKKTSDDDEEVVEKVPFRNIDQIGPAGSINSNLREMSRWLTLHLEGGQFDGKNIVSTASLSKMHSPRVVVEGGMMSALMKFDEMPYLMYGMGWFVQPYRGYRMIHHGGNIDGFSALVSFLPDEDIGVAVLTNLGGNQLPGVIALNVFDRLLGLDPVDWNKRYLDKMKIIKAGTGDMESHDERLRKSGARRTHDIDEYAGEYEHPAYGTLEVKREGKDLTVLYNEMIAGLEHWHYNVFRAGDGQMKGLKFMFLMNLRGDIDRVSAALEQSVPEIVFAKKPPARMYKEEFLKTFIGGYSLMGMTAEVKLRDDGVLTVTVPGQGTFELEPYRETEFRIKEEDGYSLRFVKGKDGIEEVLFIQPNGVFAAKKE